MDLRFSKLLVPMSIKWWNFCWRRCQKMPMLSIKGIINPYITSFLNSWTSNVDINVHFQILYKTSKMNQISQADLIWKNFYFVWRNSRKNWFNLPRDTFVHAWDLQPVDYRLHGLTYTENKLFRIRKYFLGWSWNFSRKVWVRACRGAVLFWKG